MFPAEEEEPSLTPEEMACLHAEVEDALLPYEGRLSADDLAFMREALIEGAMTGRAAALVRASTPIATDESAELARKPSLGTKKIASSR